MNRRTRRTIWIVAAVLGFLAAAIFLRSKAPPEAARLLPESDGIVYVNLKPMRAFLHGEIKPAKPVPDYQEFIDATGIDWERDLDEAAVALNRVADPNDPQRPVAYSMVLVGKITGKKLNSWLDAHATARESYAGHTVYNVPSDQGRTVRVAQIGYDMLAVSNYPTPEKIHSMLDRHATAAWPFVGSTLLSQHYHEVPLLSIAWGVGQIGLPFSEGCDGGPSQPSADAGRLGLPVPKGCAISILGLSLPLRADSTIVASIAPALVGSLHLKVEEETPSEESASSQTASLNVVLVLARGFTTPLADSAANNGLKELLNTAEVVQKHNRVVVTARLSPSIFSGVSGYVAPHETPASPDASK
ncbi:MAG: hypothetical protein ABSB60_09800 [Terracidiphilus sp.]|jgi:hypothetical protein